MTSEQCEFGIIECWNHATETKIKNGDLMIKCSRMGVFWMLLDIVLGVVVAI